MPGAADDDEPNRAPPDRDRGAVDAPHVGPTRPGWTHAAGLVLYTAGFALLAPAPFVARALVTAGAVLGCAEAPRAVIPRARGAWVYLLHLGVVALGSAGLVALWLGPGGFWRAGAFALLVGGVRRVAQRWSRPSLARRVRARMRANQRDAEALAARMREVLARPAGQTREAEYAELLRAREAIAQMARVPRLAVAMAGLQLASWLALVAGLYTLWKPGGSPNVAGALLLAAVMVLRPAEQLGLRALAFGARAER